MEEWRNGGMEEQEGDGGELREASLERDAGDVK